MSYYVVIPAPVRSADIPDGAKLMFGDIAALCKKEGYCYASNQFLADRAGVSKRTAENYVAALEGAGFIKREIMGRDERKIYLTQKPATTKEISGGHAETGGEPHAETCDKVLHNNNTVNNTQVECDFEELWKAYGRVGNKKAALRRYKRLTKAQREEVKEKIGPYVSATHKSKFPTRKHMATWLNPELEHWNDALPSAGVDQGGAVTVAKARVCCVCGAKKTHSYQGKDFCAKHDQYDL